MKRLRIGMFAKQNNRPRGELPAAGPCKPHQRRPLMPIRKLGPCQNCVHWRDRESTLLAGTAAQHGECRRRAHTAEGATEVRPAVTQPATECAEHLSMPAPNRLPQHCGDCRFWQAPPASQIDAADKGQCRVREPRWSGNGIGHAFPITQRGFYCGDGASISYVDPEEDGDD